MPRRKKRVKDIGTILDDNSYEIDGKRVSREKFYKKLKKGVHLAKIFFGQGIK